MIRSAVVLIDFSNEKVVLEKRSKYGLGDFKTHIARVFRETDCSM